MIVEEGSKAKKRRANQMRKGDGVRHSHPQLKRKPYDYTQTERFRGMNHLVINAKIDKRHFFLHIA